MQIFQSMWKRAIISKFTLSVTLFQFFIIQARVQYQSRIIRESFSLSLSLSEFFNSTRPPAFRFNRKRGKWRTCRVIFRVACVFSIRVVAEKRGALVHDRSESPFVPIRTRARNVNSRDWKWKHGVAGRRWIRLIIFPRELSAPGFQNTPPANRWTAEHASRIGNSTIYCRSSD